MTTTRDWGERCKWSDSLTRSGRLCVGEMLGERLLVSLWVEKTRKSEIKMGFRNFLIIEKS